MTEDVFGKLKDLRDDVRARIEASADWKALTALDRAVAEVKALMPEAKPEPQLAEAPTTIDEPTLEVEAVEATTVADTSDIAAADAIETDESSADETPTLDASTEDEAPNAEAEAEPELEAEAVAEEDVATDIEPLAASDAAAVIPAEDAALVADIVSTAGPAALPSEIAAPQ